jgi:hypothetical protein
MHNCLLATLRYSIFGANGQGCFYPEPDTSGKGLNYNKFIDWFVKDFAEVPWIRSALLLQEPHIVGIVVKKNISFPL